MNNGKRARAVLEILESRTLLSADASATLAGIVYSDANHNGVQDAGEAGLAGVPVSLVGTTAALPFVDPRKEVPAASLK